MKFHMQLQYTTSNVARCRPKWSLKRSEKCIWEDIFHFVLRCNQTYMCRRKTKTPFCDVCCRLLESHQARLNLSLILSNLHSETDFMCLVQAPCELFSEFCSPFRSLPPLRSLAAVAVRSHVCAL